MGLRGFQGEKGKACKELEQAHGRIYARGAVEGKRN